jgi:hypothetical protein
MTPPNDHRAQLGQKAAELLAEMRQQAGAPPAKSGGETGQGGTRVKVLSAILGIVLLVAIVAVALRLMPKDKTVPAELLGTWQTEYPSHAEHPMEFATDTLRFHTEEGWMAYGIVQVQSREEDGRMWYRFDYDAEGEEFELTFYYYAPPDERIQFENQPQLEWRKAEVEGS